MTDLEVEPVNIKGPKMDAIYKCEVVSKLDPCQLDQIVSDWAHSGLIAYTLPGYFCIFHPDQPSAIMYFSIEKVSKTPKNKYILPEHESKSPNNARYSLFCHEPTETVTSLKFRRAGKIDILIIGSSTGKMYMISPHRSVINHWKLLDVYQTPNRFPILKVCYIEADHRFTLEEEPKDNWKKPGHVSKLSFKFYHGERDGYCGLSHDGNLYARSFQFDEKALEQPLTHKCKVFEPEIEIEKEAITSKPTKNGLNQLKNHKFNGKADFAFTNNGDLMVLYYSPAQSSILQISKIKFVCKSKMDRKRSMLENFFSVELDHQQFPSIDIPQRNVRMAKFISQYRFDSVVILAEDNTIRYFVYKGAKDCNIEPVFSWRMTKEKNYESDTVLDIIMPHNVSSTMIDFIRSKRYTGSSFIVVTKQKFDILQLITLQVYQSESRIYEQSAPKVEKNANSELFGIRQTTTKGETCTKIDSTSKSVEHYIEYVAGCVSAMGTSWFLLTKEQTGKLYINVKCVKYSNPGFVIQCQEEANALQYLMKFSCLNDLGIWEMMCILSYLPIKYALIIVGQLGAWCLTDGNQVTKENKTILLHRVLFHHTLYARISNNEQLVVESKYQLVTPVLSNASNLFQTILNSETIKKFEIDFQFDDRVRELKKLIPESENQNDDNSIKENIETPEITDIISQFEDIDNYVTDLEIGDFDAAYIASMQSIIQYVCNCVAFLLKQTRKSGFKTNVLSKIEYNGDIPLRRQFDFSRDMFLNFDEKTESTQRDGAENYVQAVIMVFFRISILFDY